MSPSPRQQNSHIPLYNLDIARGSASLCFARYRSLAADHQSLDCFMDNFGPEPTKKHGYPGHPEIELAILRLYQVTKDKRHLNFAHYLLSERGVTRPDLGDERYYVWEAKQRDDEGVPATMDSLDDTAYVFTYLSLTGSDTK